MSVPQNDAALAALAADLRQMKKERDEARQNADFLRDSVGECHLMISRKTVGFQLRKEWDATSLPARLQKIMKLQMEVASFMIQCAAIATTQAKTPNV